MLSLKKKVKWVGHYIKAYYRHSESIKSYNQGIKYIKTKPKKAIKTVVFLINFPESWNSVKSIYEEATSRQDIKVLVVALPRSVGNEEEVANISSLKNDAYDFFIENGIEAIKANGDDNKWVDLNKYDPDHIIYTRPYNEFFPKIYRSTSLCKFSKLHYIPYAYGMLGDRALFTVSPEDFVFTTRKIFFANESRKIKCEEKQPRYGREAAKRYEYLGFPRFDLYNPKNIANRKYNEYTIAWLPRWTTDEMKNSQRPSHFLEFYNDFLNYAESNPDIRLIIRPHPNMFPTYISNGVMTQEEVDNFTARCANTKNIEIDTKKDYIDTIISSDLLVADYTSLIAEFFITGKPVIFCDTVAGLNDEGQKICGSLYFADTFADVVRQIEHVRDKDEDIDKRRALIKELLPDKVGNIGRNILDAIINS